MRNKVLLFVLAFLTMTNSLVFGVSASDTPAYAIADHTVNAGDEFTVDVAIANNPGIISLRFRIVYDSDVLELIEVTDTGLLSGFTTPSPTVASPYTLRWADSLAMNNNTADGSVVTLKFKALQKTSGTAVRIEHGEARSYTGEKVAFSDDTANVTVDETPVQTPAVKGDVTGDGAVDSKDYSLLLRIVTGTSINADGNPDVNADGMVNTTDLSMLKRILTGSM